MGESLECHVCGKHATVHLTQIIGNQVSKVDLCEVCAQQKGVMNPEEFSMGSFVHGVLEDLGHASAHAADELYVCESCGCDAAQIKESGRLGCPLCYERLQNVLEPILKRVHGNVAHHGKVAHKSLKKSSLGADLRSLEVALRDAIAEERYEDAAHYRDRLNALKQDAKALHVQENTHV
jgi:protein arginine kinase activator